VVALLPLCAEATWRLVRDSTPDFITTPGLSAPSPPGALEAWAVLMIERLGPGLRVVSDTVSDSGHTVDQFSPLHTDHGILHMRGCVGEVGFPHLSLNPREPHEMSCSQATPSTLEHDDLAITLCVEEAGETGTKRESPLLDLTHERLLQGPFRQNASSHGFLLCFKKSKRDTVFLF
jgi:hypothetical protein